MAALPAAPGMAGMQMRMPMAGMPAQIPMLQPTSAGQLQPQIPRAPVQLKVGDRVRPTNDKRKYGFIESIDDDKQTAIVRWEGDAAGRGGPTRKKPKVLKHLALAEDESGPPKWTKRTQLNNRLTDQQKDVLKGARFQKFTFDPENEDSQREAVSLLQRLGIKREPSDPYPSKWVTRDSYVDFKGKNMDTHAITYQCACGTAPLPEKPTSIFYRVVDNGPCADYEYMKHKTCFGPLQTGRRPPGPTNDNRTWPFCACPAVARVKCRTNKGESRSTGNVKYTSIQGFFEHTSTCATAVANLRAPALQQVANMGAQGWIADINKAVAALVHLREAANTLQGRSLQTAPDAATCKKFRDLLAREVNSAGMQEVFGAAQKAKEMCPPVPPTINVPNIGSTTGTTDARPAAHPAIPPVTAQVSQAVAQAMPQMHVMPHLGQHMAVPPPSNMPTGPVTYSMIPHTSR